MDSILKLGIVLSLQDRISSALSRISKLGGETLNKFKDMRTAIVAVSVALVALGAAWMGMGAKLAQMSGEFNYQLAAVGQISGATPEEQRALRGSAIQAGIQTQFSPLEAAEGLKTLTQAGNNAQQSMSALIPSLDLAAASMGQLTPSSAAGLVSQMMKSYGVEARNTALGVDQLIKMTSSFAVEAWQLPLILGTAARGAQSLNQSFSETIISAGLIKNVIPGAERASTALAVSMERLAKTDVQEVLQKQAGVVVQVGGKFRDFLDIIGDLTVKTAKWSDTKRAAYLIDVFGAEAMAGVNAIMGQLKNGIQTTTGETLRGAAAIAYYRDQMANAAGTGAKFREALLGTYKGVSLLLDGSLQTAAIMLGDSFEQIFKPIKEFALSGVNEFIEWWQSLNENTRLFIVAVPLAIGAIAGLTVAVGVSAAAIGALSFLLLATPVGWITLAMVALGAAISTTIIYWDEISSAIGAAWSWLDDGHGVISVTIESLRVLRDVLVLAAYGFYESFKSIPEILDYFGTRISAFFGGVWNDIAGGLRDIIEDKIKPLINSMVGWLDDKTGGWFSRAMGWTKVGLGAMAEFSISDSLRTLTAGLRSDSEFAWNKMFDGDSAAAGAKDESFIDRIQRKMQDMLGGGDTAALAGAGAGGSGGGGGGGGAKIIMYLENMYLSTDSNEQARIIEERLAEMIAENASIVVGER